MAKEAAGKPIVKPTKPRKGIKKYFREVIAEMKKVYWPSREELTRYTLAVVILVLIFAAAIGIVDYGLGQLMGLIVG